MRVFAIKNENRKNEISAYLFYYEKKKTFIIELLENSNELNVPWLLSPYAKNNIKTINSFWSKLWVSQRIVPIDRQNIGQILKDNKLKKYDEFELLVLGHGRCCQDDYYIEEIDFDELPLYIKDRYDLRIDDIAYLNKDRFLVVFKKGDVRLFELNKILNKHKKLESFLEIHKDQIALATIQVGGYSLYWNDNMEITSDEIYSSSKSTNLQAEDLYSYIALRTVNTAEACEILNCTRQNIEYLISRGKLKPIKITDKGKLFLRKDIEKMSWE